jgi:hypothetical protein
VYAAGSIQNDVGTEFSFARTAEIEQIGLNGSTKAAAFSRAVGADQNPTSTQVLNGRSSKRLEIASGAPPSVKPHPFEAIATLQPTAKWNVGHEVTGLAGKATWSVGETLKISTFSIVLNWTDTVGTKHTVTKKFVLRADGSVRFDEKGKVEVETITGRYAELIKIDEGAEIATRRGEIKAPGSGITNEGITLDLVRQPAGGELPFNLVLNLAEIPMADIPKDRRLLPCNQAAELEIIEAEVKAGARAAPGGPKFGKMPKTNTTRAAIGAPIKTHELIDGEGFVVPDLP